MTAIALNERSTWFPFIGIKEINPEKKFQQGFDFFTWIIETYIVFHWNEVRKSRCSMDEIWICQFQFCFLEFERRKTSFAEVLSNGFRRVYQGPNFRAKLSIQKLVEG